MSSSTPPANFSARLRAAREHKGLTQAQLAEKADLQPSAISHFESERRSPSFDNLRALADALGVTTDHLLGRESKPGISGPTVQKIFRNVEKMTDRDLETLAEFAEVLGKKNRSS
jgi:transcriptional regulator with XRE-family HTH domain